MRIRRVVVGATTAGLMVAGLGVAVPAQANGSGGLVLSNERTGTSPIVAGSGQKTTFTVVVTNNADYEVGGWVVDRLDEGLVIDTITTSQPDFECTQLDDVSFYCRVPMMWDDAPEQASGNIASGQSVSYTVTATSPAPVRPSTLNNCAAILTPTALPPEGDFVPTNCDVEIPLGAQQAATQEIVNPEVFAPVDVINDADLVLTGSNAGQTDPGAEAKLTWKVKNAGPSSATLPLTLTSTLPPGLSFVSAAAPWTCTATGQVVECTYMLLAAAAAPQAFPLPLLGPDESAPDLVWTVKTAKPGLVARYDVPATVVSKTADSKPANSSATSTVDVTPVDLAVVKSVGSPVLAGDEAIWSVKVSNVGTIEDAGTVTVTDTLPAGAVFKSASAEGWTCSAEDQKLTCVHTHAGLPVGATEELLVTTTMPGRGDFTNTVAVATSSYEKNTANNSASAVVKVQRVAQTAAALPASPRRILSGKTDEGQKLTTRVRCTPVKSAVAGEVSYCKVRRADGVVRVRVFGSQKMKVTVVQTAKGNEQLKPFLQRKTYIIKP